MTAGNFTEPSKKKIRREVLLLRDALSQETIWEKSISIWEKIFSLEEYRTASSVLAFVNFGSEVVTRDFLTQSVSLGKKVYCPAVTADGEMNFYRFTSLQDLQTGYKGILEPTVINEKFDKQAPPSDVFVLMPGVAFDKEKHRLGYGKGFYDRYFTGIPAFKAAVCFACQIVPVVPVNTHDILPDIVVTEHCIYTG